MGGGQRNTALQLPMFVRVLISTGMRSEYTHHLRLKPPNTTRSLKALYVLPNQVIYFGHLWGVYYCKCVINH